MKFKASLDRPAWIITSSILVLFTVLSGIGLLNSVSIAAPAFFPILLLWIIVIICFLLSPRYYIVHPDRVIIKRFWRSVTIKRSEIRLCRTISEKEIVPLTRYFGVGGLFGYFGNFLSSQQGTLKLYATRQQNFVLLYINSNRKIMLSPDEPIAFTRKVCN
ncbi:MAG: PH domain-containing protein [Chitinophagaceae bacterium]